MAGILTPLKSEPASKSRASSFVKQAPRFSDLVKDTTRTNTFLSGAGEQRITEHEGISQLDSHLQEVANIAKQANKISTGEKADLMRQNLTFIGQKEYVEATKAIGENWKGYLDANPDHQIAVVTKITQGSNLIKSDKFLFENVLGTFTEEDRQKYSGRIVSDVKALSAKPENAKVVMLDDWMISGSQMKAAASELFNDPATAKYSGSVEVHLIAASPKRLDTGLEVPDKPGESIPVKSYYRAWESPGSSAWDAHQAHITGTHSSVDYDFQHTLQGFHGELAGQPLSKTPALAYVVRDYRQHTLPLVSGIDSKTDELIKGGGSGWDNLKKALFSTTGGSNDNPDHKPPSKLGEISGNKPHTASSMSISHGPTVISNNPGDYVNVKRSNGTVEGGWRFENASGPTVTVYKDMPDGSQLTKTIASSEFKGLQYKQGQPVNFPRPDGTVETGWSYQGSYNNGKVLINAPIGDGKYYPMEVPHEEFTKAQFHVGDKVTLPQSAGLDNRGWEIVDSNNSTGEILVSKTIDGKLQIKNIPSNELVDSHFNGGAVGSFDKEKIGLAGSSNSIDNAPKTGSSNNETKSPGSNSDYGKGQKSRLTTSLESGSRGSVSPTGVIHKDPPKSNLAVKGASTQLEKPGGIASNVVRSGESTILKHAGTVEKLGNDAFMGVMGASIVGDVQKGNYKGAAVNTGVLGGQQAVFTGAQKFAPKILKTKAGSLVSDAASSLIKTKTGTALAGVVEKVGTSVALKAGLKAIPIVGAVISYGVDANNTDDPSARTHNGQLQTLGKDGAWHNVVGPAPGQTRVHNGTVQQADDTGHWKKDLADTEIYKGKTYIRGNNPEIDKKFDAEVATLSKDPKYKVNFNAVDQLTKGLKPQAIDTQSTEPHKSQTHASVDPETATKVHHAAGLAAATADSPRNTAHTTVVTKPKPSAGNVDSETQTKVNHGYYTKTETVKVPHTVTTYVKVPDQRAVTPSSVHEDAMAKARHGEGMARQAAQTYHTEKQTKTYYTYETKKVGEPTTTYMAPAPYVPPPPPPPLNASSIAPANWKIHNTADLQNRQTDQTVIINGRAHNNVVVNSFKDGSKTIQMDGKTIGYVPGANASSTTPSPKPSEPKSATVADKAIGSRNSAAGFKDDKGILNIPHNQNPISKSNTANIVSEHGQGGGYIPPTLKQPTQVVPQTPENTWHANSTWQATDASPPAPSGVDSAHVLESRPGANGNTIYRMDDGTYKSYNSATGETKGAGTWNANQWNTSNYGNSNPIPAATTAATTTPPTVFNAPSAVTAAAKSEDMFSQAPTIAPTTAPVATDAVDRFMANHSSSAAPAATTTPAAAFNAPSAATAAAKSEDMFAIAPSTAPAASNVTSTALPSTANDFHPTTAATAAAKSEDMFSQAPTAAPTQAPAPVATDAVDRFMANHSTAPAPVIKPKLTLPQPSPHDLPLGGGFGGLDPASSAHKYLGRH